MKAEIEILYYFLKVPELPSEVRHQSNSVNIVEYVAKEGEMVEAGTPIAIVENWWAVMEILANTRGFIAKTFFDSQLTAHAGVQIGDPIALILCDGDEAPQGKVNSAIKVLKLKREKPKRE